MLLVLVASNQIFKLVEVRRPAHAVEEFGSCELGLVERIRGVTGAQIQKIKSTFGKESYGRGHHEHAQVAAVVIEVVKGVIIISQGRGLDIESGGAEISGRLFVSNNKKITGWCS